MKSNSMETSQDPDPQYNVSQKKKRKIGLKGIVHIICFIVMILAIINCIFAIQRYINELNGLIKVREQEQTTRENVEQDTNQFFKENGDL